MPDAVGPLHPGMGIVLRRFDMTETDVANAITNGELASPIRFANSVYFALRITGTGVAFRSALDEYVYRDKNLYLNAEFLARCNGLPVLLQHPKTAQLNTKEFAERVIGAIVLPYIGTGQGADAESDEVWGVARILDMPAAEFMETHQVSTSPAVVFLGTSGDENEKVKLSDGKHLLIEGRPALLDHVAVAELGVWDKSGPPTGVEINDSSAGARMDSAGGPGNHEEQVMADEKETKEERKEEEHKEEEEKKDATGEKLDKLLSGLDSIGGRLDAMDSRLDRQDARLDSIGKSDAEDPEEELDQAERLEKLAEEEEEEAEELEEKADARKDAKGHRLARRDSESASEHSDRVHELAERHDAEHFCRKDGESKAKHSARVDAMCGAARRDAEKDEKEEKEERKDARRRKDSENEHEEAEKEMAKKDDTEGDKVEKNEKEEEARRDKRKDAAIADAEREVKRLRARLDAQDTTIEDLKRKVEDRPEEDELALTDAQVRADSAFSALGRRAPRRLVGEMATSYRLRALRELQPLSKVWKDSDLVALAKADAAAFANIESAIYADAALAAENPADLEAGQLRMVEKDRGGVKVKEWVGDPGGWMGAFTSKTGLVRDMQTQIKR